MTKTELRQILDERIKIANDKRLSIKERQDEDKITQTILSIAKLMFSDACGNFETAQLSLKSDEEIEQLINKLKPENNHKLALNDEQKLWLLENHNAKRSLPALTKAYNKRFNTQVDTDFIDGKCKLYGFADYQP